MPTWSAQTAQGGKQLDGADAADGVADGRGHLQCSKDVEGLKLQGQGPLQTPDVDQKEVLCRRGTPLQDGTSNRLLSPSNKRLEPQDSA